MARRKPYEEIAHITGLGPANVAVRLHRAKEKKLTKMAAASEHLTYGSETTQTQLAKAKVNSEILDVDNRRLAEQLTTGRVQTAQSKW